MTSVAFLFQTFGTSFGGAMIWQYESLRARAQTVIKGLERQISQIFEPHFQKEMDFRAHVCIRSFEKSVYFCMCVYIYKE